MLNMAPHPVDTGQAYWNGLLKKFETPRGAGQVAMPVAIARWELRRQRLGGVGSGWGGGGSSRGRRGPGPGGSPSINSAGTSRF